MPVGHAHMPPPQVMPLVHWVPQRPQLLASFKVSTQVPLHRVVPLGQLQTLFEHCWPPVHAMPQPPQF